MRQTFGGELVNIAEAYKNAEDNYEFTGDDKVIFVFPVYCGVLPGIVSDFIKKVTFNGSPDVVGIATYGASAMGVDKCFKKLFKEKGFEVKAFYDIKMVDNCVFFLDIPNNEAATMVLKRSEDRIKDVADAIKFNYRKQYKSDIPQKIVSKIGGRFLGSVGKTNKFYALDTCSGCGLCKDNCPADAIEIQSGKPVWIKAKCEFCAGCINRCPETAIQYGKKTLKRFRYVHPLMK